MIYEAKGEGLKAKKAVSPFAFRLLPFTLNFFTHVKNLWNIRAF